MKSIPDHKMKGRFKLLEARINRKFIVPEPEFGSYKLKPCKCCITGMIRAIKEMKEGNSVVLQVFPRKNGVHHINFYTVPLIK